MCKHKNAQTTLQAQTNKNKTKQTSNNKRKPSPLTQVPYCFVEVAMSVDDGIPVDVGDDQQTCSGVSVRVHWSSAQW